MVKQIAPPPDTALHFLNTVSFNANLDDDKYIDPPNSEEQPVNFDPETEISECSAQNAPP
jgi:hypothetical protein